MIGKDKRPWTRIDLENDNGGLPFFFCILAMKSTPPPPQLVRVLGEFVTCVYDPVVTYAFPDPLVSAYRCSLTQISLVSALSVLRCIGTNQNSWENMSDDVLSSWVMMCCLDRSKIPIW